MSLLWIPGSHAFMRFETMQVTSLPICLTFCSDCVTGRYADSAFVLHGKEWVDSYVTFGATDIQAIQTGRGNQR